ncbi:hypothetical protein [Clostridium estertheticum]|uniref:Uncharacterized protein n=1 Tax=Clostridium estertheticum TaxID=238834 RepID=A0A7Y3WUK0_9CLOT|nr:hypothetical protein [Clostridium estertheticum]MBW9172799.1 hypothetical protein [Clostridium estertheticum]NNU78090.1 hypothetical protein [Clostridium estertheticum]WBL49522.1 hypothetical protein LOR37_22010 [Clostridium estertheticum]WLC77676.1 hypothetical protein KTC99_22200 [Clostridium estertheticum]
MNDSINKTKMEFNKVAEEYDFMESLFDNSKFFILEMSDSKYSSPICQDVVLTEMVTK